MLELSISMILTGIITLIIFRAVSGLNIQVLNIIQLSSEFDDFYVQASQIEKLVLDAKSISLYNDTLTMQNSNDKNKYTSLFNSDKGLVVFTQGLEKPIEMKAEFIQDSMMNYSFFRMTLSKNNHQMDYCFYPLFNTAVEINAHFCRK